MTDQSGYRLRRAVVLLRGPLDPADAPALAALGGADEVLVLSMAPGEPWQAGAVKYAPGEPVLGHQETLLRHLVRAVRRRLRLSPDPSVTADSADAWRRRLEQLRPDIVCTNDPALAAATSATLYTEGLPGSLSKAR